MELDNKKLSIIVIILSLLLISNIIFSITTYFQLRNKVGPVGPKGPRGTRGLAK